IRLHNLKFGSSSKYMDEGEVLGFLQQIGKYRVRCFRRNGNSFAKSDHVEGLEKLGSFFEKGRHPDEIFENIDDLERLTSQLPIVTNQKMTELTQQRQFKENVICVRLLIGIPNKPSCGWTAGFKSTNCTNV
ncbi:MAG: hypothetical protein V3V30_08415, partial [Parvularculaceae bacterium]